jgi:hypothetical protein
MNTSTLGRIEAAMKRRRAALPTVLRPFTANHEELPRAVIVTGARGVGKSTFLLHHSRSRHFLYVSADNPLIGEIPLYEVGERAFVSGYEGIVIDEIHFAREWSAHIKALYDDFPDRSVWVSDSSSLVLRMAGADLSRRFVPISMPLLSFREYLAVSGSIHHPTFNPFDSIPINGTPELLRAFRTYRRQGTRPFFGESHIAERLVAILEKTLHSDVPFFVPQITDGNIRLMNAIVGTLAKASIPRLQVRSLCADWNIGADKLYQLLFVMESVGVVRIVRKARDTKAHTAGEKLFFGDPALYHALDGDTGTEREALTAAMIVEAGRTLSAAADERQGDFLVDGAIPIEVGGTKKQPKTADFVVRDDTDVAIGKVLPLWSLGFMY